MVKPLNNSFSKKRKTVSEDTQEMPQSSSTIFLRQLDEYHENIPI